MVDLGLVPLALGEAEQRLEAGALCQELRLQEAAVADGAHDPEERDGGEDHGPLQHEPGAAPLVEDDAETSGEAGEREIPMAPGTSGRRSSRTTGKATRKSNRPPFVPPPQRHHGHGGGAAQDHRHAQPPVPEARPIPAAGTRPRRGRRGSRRGARPPAWSPGPGAGRAGRRREERRAREECSAPSAGLCPGERWRPFRHRWDGHSKARAYRQLEVVGRSMPSGRSRGCPGSPRTRVVTTERAALPEAASTTGPARRAGPGAPRGWAPSSRSASSEWTVTVRSAGAGRLATAGLERPATRPS